MLQFRTGLAPCYFVSQHPYAVPHPCQCTYPRYTSSYGSFGIREPINLFHAVNRQFDELEQTFFRQTYSQPKILIVNARQKEPQLRPTNRILVHAHTSDHLPVQQTGQARSNKTLQSNQVAENANRNNIFYATETNYRYDSGKKQTHIYCRQFDQESTKPSVSKIAQIAPGIILHYNGPHFEMYRDLLKAQYISQVPQNAAPRITPAKHTAPSPATQEKEVSDDSEEPISNETINPLFRPPIGFEEDEQDSKIFSTDHDSTINEGGEEEESQSNETDRASGFLGKCISPSFWWDVLTK